MLNSKCKLAKLVDLLLPALLQVMLGKERERERE
jgi:hypothetical protein